MKNLNIKAPTNKAEYLNLLKECLAAVSGLNKIVNENSAILKESELKEAA